MHARERKRAKASTLQWAGTADPSVAFIWSLVQAYPDPIACNTSGGHHIHEN